MQAFLPDFRLFKEQLYKGLIYSPLQLENNEVLIYFRFIHAVCPQWKNHV